MDANAFTESVLGHSALLLPRIRIPPPQLLPTAHDVHRSGVFQTRIDPPRRRRKPKAIDSSTRPLRRLPCLPPILPPLNPRTPQQRHLGPRCRRARRIPNGRRRALQLRPRECLHVRGNNRDGSVGNGSLSTRLRQHPRQQ